MTKETNHGISIGGDGHFKGPVAVGKGATATSGGTGEKAQPEEERTADSPQAAPPAGRAPAAGGMPPFRAVLAVDAERSTDATSAQMARLSEAIVQVLETAFARAGLDEDWRDRRFAIQAHRGDGYVVGMLPERLPMLLHPFLQELQSELRDYNRRRPSSDARLRLRASVHVGPLPDAGGWSDGVGTPMAETHRLLDSDEVRRVLRDTHQDVTFLAVIVSQRVFEDVVRAGFTELHPDQFTPVIATAKRFAGVAYVYLPQHSTSMASAPI